MTLPDSFRLRMQAQLADEFPAFEAALQQPAPVSIRLNPKKTAPVPEGLQPIPWCEGGFYLPERPVFTLDPLFQAGAYYVQEASSMLIAEALRQHTNRTRALRALDLCAAPGGKSTLLASGLSDESLLVTNEVIRSRVPILRENIEKWGYPNVLVSHHDPEEFAGLEGFFDLVLVDAPCSGEGLFRKDPAAAAEWSEAAVQLCAGRQQRILAAAAPLVAEGGLLLYSTCTYNDEENLRNTDWLVQRGFEALPLALPPDWGMVEKRSGGAVGYQCYPHRVRGEGFFLSVCRRKTGRWFNAPKPRQFRSLKPLASRQLATVQSFLTRPADFEFFAKPNGDVMAVPGALAEPLRHLDATLRNKGFGLEMGLFKGNDFVPAHALALSTAAAAGLENVELSREEALRYFKKENLPLAAKGWLLARYEGLNLGWMKGVGNRVNNYLPKDWRIRMEIE